MDKKNTYHFFTLLINIGLFLIVIQSFSQTYADKEYYLIDSLNLKELSVDDKKLIDTSLDLYHRTDQDSTKLSALRKIVDECWNDNVWPKYNQWVYDFVQEELKKHNTFSVDKTNNYVMLNLLEHKAEALGNFGIVSYRQGHIIRSLEYYNESLKLSEKIDHKLGVSGALHNIAFIFRDQGKTSKALEYFFKSLKINEDIGDKKMIAASLNNIAIIYTNQGNIKKALGYYQKSLKIREKIGDKINVASSIYNIASLYQKNDNIPKALEYYQRSLVMFEGLNYKRGIANSLVKMGMLLEKDGDNFKALDNYIKSLKINEEIDDKRGVAISLNNIGNIYYKQINIKKAKEYANKSLRVAQKLGFPGEIKNAAKLLSKISQYEKNWKESFKMERLFITMRDSIRNVNTEKDVIRQQASYEIEKKEQEILLLSTQNEVQKLKLDRNKILIISFSTGFGLAVILILVTYRGYKKKQVVNKLLEKQKEEITKKNEEKKAMLKEIHHRVKNNLQVVNSLLKFQSREIEDENVVNMFKEAQSRVVSMALLHEKMYRSEDLKHINIKEHISLLITDLVNSYAVGKKIKLDIIIEEVNLGLQTLVPLGLVVNELITNSLKYAFKVKNEGVIIVSLKQISHKNYELIIGDDGIGFIQEKKAEGLGTKLMKIFAKQLNGTMTKLNQPGTFYKLVFEKIDIL